MSTTVNPYVAQQRQSNSDVLVARNNKRQNTLIVVLALIVAGISVSAWSYVASKPKFVPVIARITPENQIVYSYALEPLKEIDPIIRQELANFVKEVRTVYGDFDSNNDAQNGWFAHVISTQPAFKKLTNWAKQNNRYKRSEKHTITVQPRGVIKVSDEAWRVSWVETVYDKTGRELNMETHEASLNIEIIENTDATNEMQKLRNPLGIYVKNIDWSTVIN